MPDAPGRRLQGRVALVTGASRGIGRAVALRYAKEGAHLVLTARTQGALEELDDEIRGLGSQATLVPADLTDFEAIDRMGAAVFERFKRLDILVGNAALLGTLSPMGHIDPEDWEQVLALNLTANWRLIRGFDPLLKASEAGRAIFVTSEVTDGAWPYWGAYAVSKAGLEMMVRIYAAEVTKTKVRVNLVNPGAIKSALRSQAYPGEDPKIAKNPECITGLFVELASPACGRHGETLSAG
ncbi:MAG: SDR family NAD(P)-dependent oxidoreductase [Rhodospirillales bacterium]|jgi:NAD(P)-dependent dehydrogenase (short-subunit alcohol dehydrogenase family)|nr:SDR family NAD(P)-dependent oxidoreductase [Rhodospirillales bacterium]HIJ42569.1 SDR family NAD(P)-dependent oxidoreductase [Rhodospirillaceae bacterium]MDP7097232.1 SDR family NAD(P)-dependent oxidoreductase [Rhodospirillales bacterium]MDP7214377.1 SDR family NAD(P)-dependent oxidoreductase [Rhodospirillales bacterium]HIJ44817.1 SDR family NAD(P)-dependent oxidoreductase [Rhodospirillaceae bacterium]